MANQMARSEDKKLNLPSFCQNSKIVHAFCEFNTMVTKFCSIKCIFVLQESLSTLPPPDDYYSVLYLKNLIGLAR